MHQKGLDTAHQAEYLLYGGVHGCTAAFDTFLQKVLLHLMWEAFVTSIFVPPKFSEGAVASDVGGVCNPDFCAT